MIQRDAENLLSRGSTFRTEFLKGLNRWRDLATDSSGTPCLIYGGEDSFTHNDTRVLPWHRVVDATVVPDE